MRDGGVWKIAAGVVIGLCTWAAFERWQRQRAIDEFVREWTPSGGSAVGLAPDERCELGFVVKIRRDASGRVVAREFTFSDAAKKEPRQCAR